jgi:RNA polymerase sigma factor (sigma-70 family)
MAEVENRSSKQENEPSVGPDAREWPDSWLITAVRRDPPDAEALDALVDRYWKRLFARCEMLTLNRQKADDLAQEAWRRILRARRSLKPDGNFFAYLAMTATNLWRDHLRAGRRAGPLAERSVLSLDAPLGEGSESIALVDALPDLRTLSENEQARLRMDIDQALVKLTPLLREVLVSRYLIGESCAEIGRRHRRTEQTVSGWVREAVRIMRIELADAVPPSGQNNMTDEI